MIGAIALFTVSFTLIKMGIENNYFVFKTTAERIPEEYKLRKIIDIIPNYDLPDIEKDCFVINLESKGE